MFFNCSLRFDKVGFDIRRAFPYIRSPFHYGLCILDFEKKSRQPSTYQPSIVPCGSIRWVLTFDESFRISALHFITGCAVWDFEKKSRQPSATSNTSKSIKRSPVTIHGALVCFQGRVNCYQSPLLTDGW